MEKQTRLIAGAGKCEIEYPPELFPFRDGPDLWTGLHDVPCARAVLLEAGVRVLVLSLEIVLLDRELDADIRSDAAQTAGVPEEQIWLIATHTVTTPHFFIRPHNPPEENELARRMRENIRRAAREAAGQACTGAQEAVVGFGCGTCRANINRTIETKDGWWLGSGEEWPADHSVPVIRLDAADGTPIAVLYNYNCELSVMDKSIMPDGGRHVTADLAGEASRFVERAFGGALTALFLPGVFSDQGPAYRAVRTVRGRGGSWRCVDIQDRGWLLLELEGERLGEQVLTAAERAVCGGLRGPILLENRTFRFPGQKLRGLPDPNAGPVREWPFQPDGERTRSVDAMVLGDAVLVSADGVGIETAEQIRRRSPFARTVVISGLNGGAKRLPTDGQKYMAQREMYRRAAFQARNSEFAEGSAEKMLDDVVNFLHDIWERSGRS